MPEGGIVEVRAERVADPRRPEVDSRIRISIRDYGAGIPKEDLPRIFDPYFSRKQGGSGLGLATAYAITAKHGGHIWVESKAGEGTVFTIDLPASHETPPVQPAEESSAPATGTGRILIMDDEEPLRILLQAVLHRLGYEVQGARDGAEAIVLYQDAMEQGKQFGAVLLDLTVAGGMGGIEAAARLKEIDPHCKLIVSSGYSDTLVLSDYHQYGFDASVPKPWTVAELSKVFHRVLVPNPDRQTP
jgi:CheY-like chemotaxis protein